MTYVADPPRPALRQYQPASCSRTAGLAWAGPSGISGCAWRHTRPSSLRSRFQFCLIGGERVQEAARSLTACSCFLTARASAVQSSKESLLTNCKPLTC
jgi:hypothetical protein